MKLSFWDIMASMVMLAGLALATIFINIFVNPYSFINPFPPPTPIATLDVPTLTPSQRALPDLWTLTPTLEGAIDLNGTPTVTATGPTPTASVTGTLFGVILPTRTVTRTPTVTPTITKTFSKTPNRTLTSYYVKTATKTLTKTPEGGSGDTTPPTTPGTPYSTSIASDPNPIFSWSASSDTGGSGLKGYHITWGTDSGGNNTMYATTATSWIAPTITTPGIYYFFVRAVDEAGNESAWAGPARFGYTGVGAPSVTTSSATSISSTGATLRGVVSANGYLTTVTFDYGTSLSFGTTVTAAESPVSSSSTPVTYVLSGLLPATTYYYRAVGINAGGGPITGSPVTFTTLKTSQAALTINDPGTVTYGAGTVTLTTAGGSGTGAVTFSAGSSTGCTVTAPGVLTITNVAGTCNIVATKAGDATYNVISSAPLAITMAKATPTVSVWPTASSITFGQTLASSTLTGGTASVAGTFGWINSTTAPAVGTGPQGVRFTPTSSNNYNTVDGTSSVTVNKANQATLVVTNPGTVAYGTTATLSTTGGSGTGAVTFSEGASTGCSVSGTTLSVTSVSGTCLITATKAADADYNAATSAAITVTLSKGTPDITTWPTASGITYGDTLADSTLSGGASITPGSFAWTNSTIAPSAGTAPHGVTFTPTDTANYNNATNTVNVTVAKAGQTITFTGPGTGTAPGTAPLTASASSGLTVTFSSTTTGVCTVSGTTVTYITAGTCTIAADQAGDSNYNAAPQVTDNITVS